MIRPNFLPVLFLFLGLCNTSFSQGYTFSADSLKGFEETAAKNSAIAEGFLGNEFNVRMFRLKREYINAKYNLRSEVKHHYQFSNKPVAAAANCVNEDFESSTAAMITFPNQIMGWTMDGGINQYPATSCSLSACCPNLPSQSELITAPSTGYIDPYIGGAYPIFSVFGSVLNSGNSFNPSIPNMRGNNFIRINNTINDYSVERLSKTINVIAANAVFKYAYLSVLSVGHPCCDAGSLQVRVTDVATSSVLVCPGFSISAPGTACINTDTTLHFFNTGSNTPYTGSGTNIYNKWRINTMDLTPYIGSTLLIEVIATDCDAGGHVGYSYFDAMCSPTTFSINGTNNGINNYTICNPVFSYYIADSYLWNGPAGSGLTNVTTPTITVGASGIYTLSTTNNGCPGSTTQTLNITLSPPPSTTISSTSSSICIGGSAILTASVVGATSYSWNSGSSNPSIIVSPTATTVYSVTANYFGNCINTSTFSLLVDPCVNVNGLHQNYLSSENINIYPNPTSGNITISATDVLLYEIKVTNSIGQLMYITAIDTAAPATTFDCSKFAAGIYFIHVRTEKGTLTKKIIKE